MIAPAAALWDALLPADRERVVQWTRRPYIGIKPPAPVAVPDLPLPAKAPALAGSQLAPGGKGEGVRLVSDLQAERKRGMLVRVWRDTGLLVGVALAGAVVAIYVQPPLTRPLAWGGTAWLIMVAGLAWYVTRRARGCGTIGTAEGNAQYQADPKQFAVGGANSFCLGAGLGMAAMTAALIAKAL